MSKIKFSSYSDRVLLKLELDKYKLFVLKKSPSKVFVFNPNENVHIELYMDAEGNIYTLTGQYLYLNGKIMVGGKIKTLTEYFVKSGVYRSVLNSLKEM